MSDIKSAVTINKIAYEVEKQNPDLDFFEVNKKVQEIFGDELNRLVNEPEEVWMKKIKDAYCKPKIKLGLIK